MQADDPDSFSREKKRKIEEKYGTWCAWLVVGEISKVEGGAEGGCVRRKEFAKVRLAPFQKAGKWCGTIKRVMSARVRETDVARHDYGGFSSSSFVLSGRNSQTWATNRSPIIRLCVVDGR